IAGKPAPTCGMRSPVGAGLPAMGPPQFRLLSSELVKFCAIFRARDFSSSHRSPSCKQPSRYLTIPSTGPNVSVLRHSCR
ncbi:hypothetical protein F3K52_28530, partial [Pseudomonas lactis]